MKFGLDADDIGYFFDERNLSIKRLKVLPATNNHYYSVQGRQRSCFRHVSLKISPDQLP